MENFGSMKNFDALTMFKDGEDDEYFVEYLLVDNMGFNHRCSPFLIPVGTVFEHNYGTYEVISIDRKMLLPPKQVSSKTQRVRSLKRCMS
jgi:hypothetical protein